MWSDPVDSFEPFAIVELKRSFFDPEEWKPFENDKPNYAAIKKLADRADLPLWIIYFKKDQEITGSSKFHIFDVKEVNPSSEDWIEYDDKLMTANEFKEDFPEII